MSGQGSVIDDGDDGYWRLAQFMATSPEHAIFRGFNALSILNLLRLQAELQDLEDEVKETLKDDKTSGDEHRSVYGRNFGHMRISAAIKDRDATQLKALINVGDKLEKYRKLGVSLSSPAHLFDSVLTVVVGKDAALKQVMLMNEAARPTESARKFLRDWLSLDKLGGNFLADVGIEAWVWNEDNRDDLLLLQQTDTGMDTLVDLYHKMAGQFRKSKIKDGVRMYSPKRVSRLGEALAVELSAVLPTVAILVLYFIPAMIWRIVAVVIMTFIFATVMALTTGAKKSEVFGATAAFAAVEVVYIGSTSFGQN